MDSIYLDTALLAVPNYAVSDKAAEDIIGRVVYYAKLVLPGSPVVIVLSSAAEAVLWDNHCGPDYNGLEDFLGLMGLQDVFSVQDLITQYQIVLAGALRVETLEAVEIVRISSFRTLPPLPAGLTPSFLESETQRAFATVAAMQTFDDGWSVGSAIYDAHTIAYETEVVIDRATGSRTQALGELPRTISASVRALTHLRDLVSRDNARRLWVNSKTAGQLYFAIVVTALTILKEQNRPAKASLLRQFSLGPDFLPSLQASQCERSSRYSASTQTLCGQIVAGVCNKKIRPFGKPDQQIRGFDRATAWRVHLTEGAVGLRLMFWDNANEIEFANVGAKRELYVAPGQFNSNISVNVDEVI